jgi:hypothetical protein
MRIDPPRRARRAALLTPPGRSWTRAAVTLAVLAAAAIVWLGARTALSQFAQRPAQQPVHVAARPTATTTLAPTAAPTSAPTPATTPTPSPQQIADAQAAAAFRAITVTTQPDNGCAATTRVFTTTQSINVNICVAQSARSGLMTVQLRQSGAIVVRMADNISANPGWWYSWTTHNRPAGSYDVLVTYNNGTAADIGITVT